ncbi:hypothetical protein [Neisseria dentiae]|uniref:hypothetical protein n=1 Tax=Neisseria dentiae TaxID=194197 RepID=UPI0035A04268
MSFVYRYFLDDYGLLSTAGWLGVLLYFVVLSVLIVTLMFLHLEDRFFALKCIAFVCLIGWGAFGNFVWSNMGHQHIAIHGTAQQKATLKRCAKEHGNLKEITIDDIGYVMYTCQTADNDQKLRDSIFK